MKFLALISTLAIGAQSFSIPVIPKRETGITGTSPSLLLLPHRHTC